MTDEHQEKFETEAASLAEGANRNKVKESEEKPEAGSTQEEYQELHNRYLRLAADFDNFRKRQAQEREFLLKYGAQAALETMLPVLDNLERAKQNLSENSDPAIMYKSFEMMSQQLLDALKNIGLQKMSPKGEVFDPECHEAISQVETKDLPDMTIREVYKDGYTYHDRVIRPAQVVVSVMPEEEGTANNSCNIETPQVDPGFKPENAIPRERNPFRKVSGGAGEGSGQE